MMSDLMATGKLGLFAAGVLLASSVAALAATADSSAQTSASVAVGGGAAEQILRAGPVRVKFADGELRHLYVGNKEIARRIYFAVRDKDWDTIMPRFTNMKMESHSANSVNSFSIDMTAVCTGKTGDYTWTGHIDGLADGTIRFHAGGHANRDFESGRIGICLLYGVESLSGQSFEVADAAGTKTAGAFPALVSPGLVAAKFQTLQYTTASGMTVEASIAGTEFDMEDQRNWGDSSFKAYAPLAYAYPAIKTGQDAEETLTLHVRNAVDGPAATDVTYVKIGGLVEHARVPRLVVADPKAPGGDFVGVNTNRPKVADAKTIVWALNPSNHLPDDDNFMDNVTSVMTQAKTARSFAPHAKLRIDPVTLNNIHPGAGLDSRNETAFGAAWSAAVLKYLSLGGVDEAAFAVGPGTAHGVQQVIGAFAGDGVYETDIRSGGPPQVEAFAVDHKGSPVLWLINLCAVRRTVVCESPHGGSKATLLRGVGSNGTTGQPDTQTQSLDNGRLQVALAPYEVCQVTLDK